MREAMWKKVLAVAVVLSATGLIVGTHPLSVGQEAKKEKTEKKAKGMLPPYFADIVTEEQRTKIYEIRAGYLKQREALEAQLAELRNKEMSEIEGLLTPEQKEKLEKAREEAAAKKKKKADEKKAAEGAKKAAPGDAQPK
jgi:hypothetical protein